MSKDRKLPQIPLLKDLPPAERRHLDTCFSTRSYKKGELLAQRGEQSNFLLLLIEGSCKVTRQTEKGKEVIIATLQQGEPIGEIALLTGQPRTTDVSAVEDVTCLVITEKDFRESIPHVPYFLYALCTHFAYRLHKATRRITDLALYDTEQRVARILLTMATKTMRDSRTVFVVSPPPKQSEIANMAGTSREVVSRSLKKLEERGVLEKGVDELILLENEFWHE